MERRATSVKLLSKTTPEETCVDSEAQREDRWLLPSLGQRFSTQTQWRAAKGLWCLYGFCVLVLCRIAQRERMNLIQEGLPSYNELESLIPNFPYIFTGRIPTMCNPTFGPESGLCVFGFDVKTVTDSGGSWADICKMDSDRDGDTNGMEMGDPCCKWVPGAEPYRRWDLKHPGRPVETFTFPERKNVSLNCDASDQEQREAQTKQFSWFYYRNTPEFEENREGLIAPSLTEPFKLVRWISQRDELWWAKLPLIFSTVGLILDWFLTQGLCKDFLGIGPAAVTGEELPLPRWKKSLLLVTAWWFTDTISAITHITFDFIPRYFPLFGAVATGFQFHHVQPRAWVEQPIAIMFSHAFTVLGIVSMIMMVVKPRRSMRFFWTLIYGFTLTIVLTHRWGHVKEEELPLWWKTLQSLGVVMTNERHMHHHHELTQQFGQLSGASDFIIDPLCRNVVAPHRFEFWTSLMLLVYVALMFFGSEVFRQRLRNKCAAE